MIFALTLLVALQDPVVDAAIERKLASEDAVDVAWGAFLAGSHDRTDLGPVLIERLGQASGRHRVATEKVLLDALIRLEAEVPPEVLRAVHGRQGPVSCRTELLLVAARDAEEHADLLRAILDHDDTHGQQWWGAARLLASVRAAGVAERVLPHAAVELQVTFVDDAEDGGMSGASFGVAGYVTTRPEAFPPAAEYRFVTGGARGARPVVTGDLAFQVVRTETRRRSYPPPSTAIGDREPHALACLAFLADEDHPPDDSDSLVVVRGPDAEAVVAARVAELEEALRRLVGGLVAAGVLDAERAAEYAPRVRVHRHEG